MGLEELERLGWQCLDLRGFYLALGLRKLLNGWILQEILQRILALYQAEGDKGDKGDKGDWWGDWKKGGAGLVETEAKQISIQLKPNSWMMSQAGGKRKRMTRKALGLDLHADPRET